MLANKQDKKSLDSFSFVRNILLLSFDFFLAEKCVLHMELFTVRLSIQPIYIQMHSIVSISCFHALLRITLNLTLCKSFNTAFVSFRASLSLSTRSFFLKPNKSARFWLPGLSATNKGEKQQKYQQNKRRKKSSCYFL